MALSTAAEFESFKQSAALLALGERVPVQCRAAEPVGGALEAAARVVQHD